MGDLCFEKEAEKHCKRHIKLGFALDAKNVDILLANANYQLVKQNKQQGTISLHKIFKIIKNQ